MYARIARRISDLFCASALKTKPKKSRAPKAPSPRPSSGCLHYSVIRSFATVQVVQATVQDFGGRDS